MKLQDIIVLSFVGAAGLSFGLLFFPPSSNKAPDQPEGVVVGVTMVDNSFSPDLVRIGVGGSITFRNGGRNPHNAEEVSGKWGTTAVFGSEEMDHGQFATITFPEEGVYRYLCTFHADSEATTGMVGTVVVGDVAYEPPANERVIPAVAKASGKVRKVPAEYPSIQAAVDAAEPGDVVWVGKGIYKEEVIVTTPSLILRGEDRNQTIIDGEFERGNGVMVAGADGVAVENMTARHHVLNGFYWTGVKGYRGSYLTAHNNGDYGVYAFNATDGLFNDSYASANPDSGFYIGQCRPCRAAIERVVSENNGLGYSGSNSSGEIYLVSSVWAKNQAGMAPNSLDSELLPPQSHAVLAGNLVVDNNNLGAPTKKISHPAFGNGIILPGTIANWVSHNVIADHDNHGILALPNVDQNFWAPIGNRIESNIILHSKRADIALGGPSGHGNCFANNQYRTTIPFGLELFQSCSGWRLPVTFELSPTFGSLGLVGETKDGIYPTGDWKTFPAPPPQPNMPDDAPIHPATNIFDEWKAARPSLEPQSFELPEAAKPYLNAERS